MGSDEKKEHKNPDESRHKKFIGKVEKGSDRINEGLDNFENGLEKGVQKGYHNTKNAFKNLKHHHKDT